MKKLLILGALFLIGACASNDEPVANATQQIEQKKPYVILISIDGFRWDYVDKYQPKFLSKFAKEGASLKSMRPSFPTKTFPNHLALVTGSYPQNHGIVANKFYAPDLDKTYYIKDSEAVTNSDFYLRKPLWVYAQQQGINAASYFWPSSEAEIDGVQPSIYMKYQHTERHQKRVDAIVKWLQLPEEKRPQFITTYFHDVDSAGHTYGQDSSPLINAINSVDRAIEQLVTRVRQLDVDVNFVIVSDHGMDDYPSSNYEYMPAWIKDDFKIAAANTIVHLYKNKDSNIDVSQALIDIRKQAKHYQCYEYQDVPTKFNASKSPRMGDITCFADKDWAIGFNGRTSKGDHGWSQFNTTDMDAIFYAQGPAFKKQFQMDTVENIHVMPLLAHILGVKINGPIDGKLKPMKPLLK
ncbi:MAG: ectonucleotide pyrophosphatase/phosphodiesterase [Psychrobium sp.]